MARTGGTGKRNGTRGQPRPAKAPAEAFGSGHVAACWTEALAVWDVGVGLSPPETYTGRGKSHWSADEPLAYIDLETRQVVVNFHLLAGIGAASSLTAVLAHEIGHHVRFPHTLGLAAALQVLERRLIPGLRQSLTNLFFDLLVNEFVGRTRSADLAAVYRGFVRQQKGDTSPLFYFYLTVYEELWGLEPGSLAPPAAADRMERAYPGHRPDARMFVQTFYALPRIHLQFVYFCARFLRYIPEPSQLEYRIPMAGDVPQPDADDFDAALRGNGAQEANDALDEARERGWLDESGLVDTRSGDPLAEIDRITSGMPGTSAAAFKQTLVSKHYQRLVDQHILKLPPVTPLPEPALPTVLEEWDWGDSPRAIDWTGTLVAAGPLAPVRPLRRELDPDEPSPRDRDFPAVEIYLDTSGSMPDPASALNAMTLAAQILAASALRKRGRVRGIVYSWGRPRVSEWMYDEETARLFLLQYAGGGTDFPFDLARRFSEDADDAIRVIVSDGDFLANVRGAGAMDKLQFTVDHSRLLVAFLATSEDSARTILAPVLRHPRFRLATVKSASQFAQAASDLADALLG